MITLEEAAAGCENVRWQGGDSFIASCVAHNDKNPSMCVSERDGKILVYCHAGCSQDAVMRGLGMTGSRNPRPFSTGPKRPVMASPTADYAKQIWQRTRFDELINWDAEVAAHPYAIRKGIKHAYGAARGAVTGKLVGMYADCIVLPMRTVKGSLTGVECINAIGVKQTFGNKGVLQLGNTLDKPSSIYVVEGWADGIAVRRYFGDVPVVIAFGKGRMEPVARDLDKTRPDLEIIIVRDAV